MGATRVLVLVLATSCGGPDYSDYACPEGRVTIDSGVYGVVWRECEINCDKNDPPTVAGILIQAYPPAALGEQPPIGDALAEMRTDDHGFYELELGPGAYDLCRLAANTNPATCARVSVEGARVRYDLLLEWTTARCVVEE